MGIHHPTANDNFAQQHMPHCQQQCAQENAWKLGEENDFQNSIKSRHVPVRAETNKHHV
eukprot:CAMPEP_0178404914 /NCGR_PEP_ID=MMETSP0689_2-20121128/18132_1 /TAXON_ID=160604 /ORGANISM="Amphidinium massartii, Strain CS-259" /LENGTH=58 /DNA_ID=CAMNT_0020025919 /DNA_START=352 /DNA_END=528 /DNA_ORIENTATION=+